MYASIFFYILTIDSMNKIQCFVENVNDLNFDLYFGTIEIGTIEIVV